MKNLSVAVEGLNILVSTERKMLRMMRGVTLWDRINSSEVAERMRLKLIEERVA